MYTPLRNILLCQLFRALSWQWISAKIKVWHPWQLKKSKSWGPYWSYQLTALPIQPIWSIFEVNGLNWHYCLAGSSKTAPRILIFSIAMVADYSFYVKNIDIWALAFFKHNNSFIATVYLINILFQF